MRPLTRSPIFSFTAGLTLTLAATGAAWADDTEIFSSQTFTTPPNILFIFDTSGSMSSAVTVSAPYNPATNYSGDCNSDRIYYKSSGDPDCDDNSFVETQLKCTNALGLLDGSKVKYIDYMIRWRKVSSSPDRWAWTASLSSSNTTNVECFADDAVAGDIGDTVNSRPRTGQQTSSSAGWTNSANLDYWAPSPGTPGTKTSYTLMSGNYLNWLENPPTTTLGTRMTVAQQAATELLDSLNNVNVGLMRYSADVTASGGMVMHPVLPLEPNRATLTGIINGFSPSGFTPLSETLFEGYRYLSGGNVFFGNTSMTPSGLTPSVPASRVGGSALSNQYQTPIAQSCQKNFIVYLTDGQPTLDNQADAQIEALPNFATYGGPCTASGPPGAFPGTSGRCLGALSEYMFKGDLLPDNAALPATEDQQNAQTYFIAFGDDPALAASFAYLQDAAQRGGGEAYTALSANDLSTVFSTIVADILKTNVTFVAPTVAVNAFNRAQTLSDLYVSVFQPSGAQHWPGNLKKYRFSNHAIVDRNGLDAVNPVTGFFKDSAQEFWSSSPDGADVLLGGAANQIPDHATRNVYTYIGANPATPANLANGSHNMATTNAAITTAVLGIGSPGDPTRDDLINWARGQDINDDDGDTSTTDSRRAMGDPIHGQPAVVIYGGSAATPDVTDAVVYAPTNDGYLHAFRVTDGRELWAFMPQEHLGDVVGLFQNAPTATKHYSLDGDIRVLKYDINGNGVVDGLDRVWLYFGQRRGGSKYFALDVTDKAAPRFMWSIGDTASPGDLNGIGETWSTPTLARVNVQGATQNAQRFVLIFAGGHDPVEDGTTYVPSDSMGNQIFIVDAISGARLWYASSSGADLNLTRMDHSIPSPVSVLDLDGNGYADRMYVGDTAAQLWRFDIYNGNPAASLVTGGAIASLGAHDDAVPTAAATRRFYHTPDIAAIQKRRMNPFFNIAIGSGYRGHPLDTTAHETFYSIRDYQPFVKLTQVQYNALSVVHDADLTDVTTVVNPTMPAGSPGWKMHLNQPDSNWIGEKALASATTVNNQVLFTTYTPNVAPVVGADPCQIAGAGKTRVYAVGVFDGSPQQNLDQPGVTGPANTVVQDRYVEYSDVGIPSNIQFLFTDDDGVPGGSSGVDCMEGVRVLGVCTNIDTRIKTYWRESGAN